jgi:hypothetical protein
MLFVLHSLRNLIVKQHNMKMAEGVLESIARKCSDVLQLKECTLMFDDTNRVVQEEKFSVCSARPTYPSTDDAFVAFAAKLSEPAIFVTSDRELIQRLQDAGKEKATICKPKSWFQFLAHLIGGIDSNDMGIINGWFTEAWMADTFAKLNISSNGNK